MNARWVACLAVFLFCSACTTTDMRIAGDAGSFNARGAKVLVVYPEVQLGLLTANGMTELREDWSQASAGNLALALRAALSAKSLTYEELDPQASMAGRIGQVLRLNSTVGQSIELFEYGPYKLPSKEGRFEWTLGDGAKALGANHGARYALFVSGRGTFTSGGRMALAVGAAILGVAIPVGSQHVYVSLVELETGRVIWFNVANAGDGTDVRTPEGARSIVDELVESAPL